MGRATVEDLGLILDREIDPGQQRRAERILEIAEGKIAQSLGLELSAYLSDPHPTAEAVVLSVAARAFENPLVLSSESAGPWSGAYRAGGFELTNYERTDLAELVDGPGAVYDVGIKAPERYNTGWDDDPRVPEWVANR